MGRMKEVFMQMREDNWEGTHEEYLKHYVETNKLNLYKSSLCPACMSNDIQHRPNDKVTCTSCGQNFIIKDNIISFK